MIRPLGGRVTCRVALLLIVIVAVALRLHGLAFGLPSLNDPDEPIFVLKSVSLLADHTLNPKWFGHPGTTTIYSLALIDVLLGAGAIATRQFASVPDFAMHVLADPTPIVLSGRIFILVCGIATILLTYRIGRRIADVQTGLVASAILALLPIHIAFSQIIRTDMHATVFMLMCVLASISIAEQGRLRDYGWAAIAAGAAIATKWPAGIVLFCPLAAALSRVATDRGELALAIRGLMLVALATPIALVTISPYLLLDFAKTRADLFGEFQPYHLGSTGGTFLENLRWYGWGSLRRSFGIAGLAMVVGGIVIGVRSNRIAVVAAVVPFVAFFTLICAQPVVWERWAVPLLPFAALLAALSWTSIAALLRPRLAQHARVAAGGVAALALGVPMLIVARANAAERITDTRDLATAWVQANVPAGRSVGLENMAFALPIDGRWRLLMPAGDVGCIDVAEYLNPNLRIKRVDDWRAGRAVVDFGTIKRETMDTCRADFAIFSHYDRYLLERSRFPNEITMYRVLAQGGRTRAIIRPIAGKVGGPTIRIVELAPRR